MNPIQQIYERQATTYDITNSMMEILFGKARHLLRSLWGDILEVGVGTGLNLPYYSPRARVTALDWSPCMVELSRHRAKRLDLKQIKSIRIGDAQDLKDIPPNSFDFVTSSCVFCSIPNPIKALKEIARVLRPHGLLIQIEHGRSKIPLINQALNAIEPIMVKMKGAHLTREHEINLDRAGFAIVKRRELDPAGITRVIISLPIKLN